mmetsp:Transcript_14409/g.28804  ORF Transcript_14409/g.28804 Transcript_14409/m.28804 type:complete len:219 (+) Transcript_14409:1343-1999(+)
MGLGGPLHRHHRSDGRSHVRPRRARMSPRIRRGHSLRRRRQGRRRNHRLRMLRRRVRPLPPSHSRRIGRRRRLDRGRPLHRHRRPHLLSHVRSGYPGVPRRVRRRHCLRGRRQGRLRELRLRMHRDLRRALSPSFAESRGGRGGVVRARCLHGIHGPHFLSHLRCQCAGMSRRVRRRHGLRGRGQGLRRKYRLFVPGRLRHHLPTIRPRRLRRIPRVD